MQGQLRTRKKGHTPCSVVLLSEHTYSGCFNVTAAEVGALWKAFNMDFGEFPLPPPELLYRLPDRTHRSQEFVAYRTCSLCFQSNARRYAAAAIAALLSSSRGRPSGLVLLRDVTDNRSHATYALTKKLELTTAFVARAISNHVR